MSSAAVITEFLASVGFQADEKSLKTSLVKVAAFGVAVQTVALGIYAGIVRVASGEAELARQAERLCTTTDRIRELGYVAEQSGSSLDAVTNAMQSIVNKNPRIKDSAAALEQIGERMQGMSRRQRELYADKWGIDRSLIPALTKDTAALKSEFRQMYEVAGINAQEAGKASRSFMAEIGKLKSIVDLLGKSVALTFITRIRGDIEHLRRVVMDNFGPIKRFFEAFIAVVLRISGVISAFVYCIIKWASGFVAWFDTLDAGQKKLVVGLGLLLAAWRLLNAGFLATPLGMIIAGLLAIIALIDDYQTYMEGGESFLDWGPWAKTIEGVVSAIKGAVSAVGNFISGNQALFSALGTGIAVTMAFKGILGAVAGVFGLVQTAVRVLFGILRANPLGIIITLAMLIYEYWEPISAFFAKLWAGIWEKFPNFAAMAESGARAIKEFFGPAIAWVKGMLANLLPDWLAKKLGLKEGAQEAQPAPAPPPDLAAAALNSARAASPAPALTPTPAKEAALAAPSAAGTEINANTTIHVTAPDAESAGRKVAEKQADVNADLVRHAQRRSK
jgi:hypothetical protein